MTAPSTSGRGTVDKQQKWRDAIKTTKIIKRLNSFALENLDREVKEGDKPIDRMTATQVNAAKILLNRTVPEMKLVEQTIEFDSEGQLILVAPGTLNPEAWAKLAASKG